MKKTSLIILAAGALALAGCANLQLPTLPPVTDSRSTVLSYESPAAGTRTLAVLIPANIQYKNMYLRQFVGNYIGSYNLGLIHQIDYWTLHKNEPFAQQNLALYQSAKLKQIRDLDTIAPDEPMPSEEWALIKWNNDQGAATNDAERLVQNDLHALLKQERN